MAWIYCLKWGSPMHHCDVPLELGRLDRLKHDIFDTERKCVDQKGGHRDLPGFGATCENDRAHAGFEHFRLDQASMERAGREAPHLVGQRRWRYGCAPRFQQPFAASRFGRATTSDIRCHGPPPSNVCPGCRLQSTSLPLIRWTVVSHWIRT